MGDAYECDRCHRVFRERPFALLHAFGGNHFAEKFEVCFDCTPHIQFEWAPVNNKGVIMKELDLQLSKDQQKKLR